MAQDINYEEGRDRFLENEVFLRIDPRYPITGSAISLVLSGEITSYPDEEEEYGYYVDTESIANQNFTVRGIGFPLAEYEDTLRNCIEVWIPIEDSEGTIQEIRFKVKKRSSYRDWIYLWNYEEDNGATVSGSWIVDGFSLAEEPYDVIGTRPELDYNCSVLGPDRSIIFVYYEPTNFRFNGDYNATLNNALTESKQDLFINSASIKIKKYISDYHKIQGIGGHSAGELNLDQGTDKEYVRVQDFMSEFKGRTEQYGEEGLQTLDLAFMSYRAISASVYVDRLDMNRSASISKVWDDIQEGNTDDPETAYFIPRCSLTGSSENPYVDFTHTTTVPTVGDLIFTIDQHTPVRYVEATLYAPFLNRVYRTDKFGAIVEEFPNSDFGEEEEV